MKNLGYEKGGYRDSGKVFQWLGLRQRAGELVDYWLALTSFLCCEGFQCLGKPDLIEIKLYCLDWEVDIHHLMLELTTSIVWERLLQPMIRKGEHLAQ